MLLQIHESRTGEITLLTMEGKFALGRESQRIESLVDDLAARADNKVIFDMTGVNYIDSAGIGMLALAAGKLRQSGGKLVVVSPPEGRTSHMMKLTQMDAIVPVVATVDEARAAFTLTQPPATA
jgi:anti-anti-sigma factor